MAVYRGGDGRQVPMLLFGIGTTKDQGITLHKANICLRFGGNASFFHAVLYEFWYAKGVRVCIISVYR